MFIYSISIILKLLTIINKKRGPEQNAARALKEDYARFV